MNAAPEAGATPTELRLAVLRNGWSPLPVAGKRPTLDDWSKYCGSPATDHEIAYWGRSHGGAVSTGLALGHQAGIDIDVLSDPALAAKLHALALDVFGPTPFVRVGRAPKLALVYRAAPDVVSASYKAASGNGDGLDILASGRQIVGFGRHVETGLPYTWVGDASPLDARPEAAPVITADQVAEFIVRVETVMSLGGGAGGGRKGGGGGGATGAVRNAAGLVSDGREGFLFGCVWRAAHDLHQAKVDLTAEALTEAAWAFFADPTRGAVVGDGRWGKADAAYRAKLTIRRLEAGTVTLEQTAPENRTAEPIAPTYPDRSVPVDEARAAVRAAIEGHFAVGPGVRAIKVSTGVGKTRIAAEVIAADILRRRASQEPGRRAKKSGKAVRDKRGMLYAVPTHRLGGEVEGLFAAAGVTARVFRGRTAPDPDMPDTGRMMCLDPEAVQIALKAGATVSTACCSGKHPVTGTKVECKFFHECAYQAQLRDTPDVWIAAHQILFQAQAGLGDVAGVVIDEGFWEAGLKMDGKGMTLDDVGAQPSPPPAWLQDTAADVAENRRRLAAALRRQEDMGGVERRHLVAEGLDADFCGAAYKAEWDLKPEPVMWPGMGITARRAAVKAGAAAKRVRTYAAIWDAARELLQHEDVGMVSGRLILAEDTTDEGTVRVVRTRGVSRIASAWRENSQGGREKPTLILDATLPAIPVLQAFYPEVEIVADIEAAAPHARVTQILGAPTSANKLHRGETDRNHEAVRRAILHRWVRAGRPKALVVAQEKTEEWLKASGLPSAIEVRHFNAIAGLDGFRGVGLLVIVGRTLPNVLAMEAMSGAITGVQGSKTAESGNGGPRWYDKATLGIRMADGTGRAVEGDRHPDPVAEALRWQVAEAEVMQAIGRARGVNRTAADPVEVVVMNDLCLPLTVDEVVRWDDVPAGREVDAIVDGIVLESAPDMAVCWPAVWGTAEGARTWRKRTTEGQIPIEESLYRSSPLCGPQNCRPAAFRYQHHGERQKWRRGWHLPAVVPDPRGWLEARLGELRGFELVAAVSPYGP